MQAKLKVRNDKVRSEIEERSNQDGYLTAGNLAKLLKQSLGLPDFVNPKYNDAE